MQSQGPIQRTKFFVFTPTVSKENDIVILQEGAAQISPGPVNSAMAIDDSLVNF